MHKQSARSFAIRRQKLYDPLPVSQGGVNLRPRLLALQP
jgi:hypothetical protein